MKLIYRAIANATTLVTVVLFLLLTITFMVAPKATAAVISNLFRLELESPFWNEGGVVFLGGAILWVGGILLAAGGGTLLFERLVRGSAHRPAGKPSFNESSANVERREEPKLTLEPRPTAARFTPSHGIGQIGQVDMEQETKCGVGRSRRQCDRQRAQREQHRCDYGRRAGEGPDVQFHHTPPIG